MSRKGTTHNENTKLKIKLAKQGIRFNEESKLKMRIATLKSLHNKDKNNFMFGKAHLPGWLKLV